MVFKSRIEHMEEIFLRQFDQEGDRILYRKHGRGAPIPVSLEERESFRAQYRQASVRMIWSAVLLTLIAIALGMVIAPEFLDEGPGIMIITLSAVGAISVLSIRNSTAPARALERRSPVGNELTAEEWQSKHFAATSWPLLGSIFALSTIVCVWLGTRSGFRDSSDYLWLIGSGVMSLLGARALWLKHRLSSGQPH